MKYHIEKNIEVVTTLRSTARRELIGSLKQMEIGDSIIVADLERVIVSNTTASFRLYADKQFQTKSMKDGIRVWRTK